MYFASDNSSGAHDRVLAAVIAANAGYQPSYGSDPLTEGVRASIRDLFEAPEAAVELVATGTACNSLILGTLTQPFDTVFCTPMAHINVDECNAPEFYTGGAKLTLVPAVDGKMTAEALRVALSNEGNRGVHGPQRGPVSITQITEDGTLYALDEIAAIGAVCREFGVPLHLDGARFANALVALDCTPAEMTWKAGVSAVSFGGSKNGCMGVEAAVFFDAEAARSFGFRRKRGGHLFSKHRYLAAQMQGYLEDGLWLEMARHANAMAARLARGLRQMPEVELGEAPGNMLFPRMPQALHDRAKAAGAQYHVWAGGVKPVGRLVASFSTTEGDVDAFLAALRGD